MSSNFKIGNIGIAVALVLCMVLAGSTSIAADKYENISASAFGTGTQVGGLVRVNLVIYKFSSDQDRQTLIKAFQTGQSQGVADALSKMPKPAGHIDVTGGGMGYDVNFIRMIPTPTGKKIRFITNRKIAGFEARADTQSMSFNLTAGEFDINTQDKKKSTGTLFPAAQLIINKQGELQFELNQNAWRLEAVTDSGGSAEN